MTDTVAITYTHNKYNIWFEFLEGAMSFNQPINLHLRVKIIRHGITSPPRTLASTAE